MDMLCPVRMPHHRRRHIRGYKIRCTEIKHCVARAKVFRVPLSLNLSDLENMAGMTVADNSPTNFLTCKQSDRPQYQSRNCQVTEMLVLSRLSCVK